MTLVTAMTMDCKGSLNGVAAPYFEMIDAVMGGNMGSTSATKSDAGVKVEVRTSSRTSLPAGIEIAVPLGREELIVDETSCGAHGRVEGEEAREG
jgi:hypothetical protein